MRKTLEIFNDRASRLLGSPLANKVLLGELKCSFSWAAGKGMDITSPDYNKNDLDAFILSFRLFVQDNEPISLRNIHRLYEASSVPQDLKDAVTKACATLNSFLNSPMIMQWPDSAKTYREHFDIVLYGELAHMKVAKAELFQKWTSDGFISMNVWTLFLMVLQNILATISYIRVVNEKAIQRLT